MSSTLSTGVFALGLGLPFFWMLGAEEFHGDETHWISAGRQAFHLLASGRLADPEWREEFYLYSQPQVAKLLIGAVVAGAGHTGPAIIRDYDWQLRPAENQAAGRVPPDDVILAARLPGALTGWLTCLLLWALAAELGGGGAGVVGALLLASHPLWLANARRAGLDVQALCFGVLASWAALRAVRTHRARAVQCWPDRPEPATGHTALPFPRSLCSLAPRTSPAWPPEARWWMLAAVAVGVATSAKYVGLLAALPAAAAGVLLGRQRYRPAAPAAAVSLLLIAPAVFWAANPTLYAHPTHQLAISVDFFLSQAGEMRRTSPVFTSPALVAAEIVDRAVWPTGFPHVVDYTLPNPSQPGSYGTPLVALGVAVALIQLCCAAVVHLRLRHGGRDAADVDVLVVATAWTAAVFALLALSIPIWWERWHLPLIPPLCLLAGAGIARLAQGLRGAWLGLALAAAQYVSALAMGPSYLGKGFGALVTTPLGGVTHLAILAVMLVALVSHIFRSLQPTSGIDMPCSYSDGGTKA